MARAERADEGAHYYRCDFQVHSPRDNQWKGSAFASADERKAYAEKFIAHCRSIGLDALAITDHHDFVFFPYIKAAAAAEVDAEGNAIAENDRIVVFPGLELTLGSPTFQAILILDAEIPGERLTDVLQALAIEPHDETASKLPSVKSIDHISTPKELHEALDQREWLRGRYIVLPNVTDKGHKTMLRSGMKVVYREMPCVGGYLDGTVDKKVGNGNAQIFAGKNAEYGNKRIALFQTSDSRSEKLDELGIHSTWVKWAVPTAEALRQACLAQESRIAQSEPALPTTTISRLNVSNSKFLGPIDVAFNSQYNAVIGGRGTGKSTILGYLRWALCDEPGAGDETSESGGPAVRQRKLIEATLAPLDAVVEVDFVINGIPHTVRRSAAEGGEILLKVGDDAFEVVREQHVRSLLPIQAYSQKQLSSVAVRVDELTRFITSPIQARLDEFDRRIAELSGKLRENYATLQRARVLDQAIERSALQIRSLASQAESLRTSLAGLGTDEQAVLADKPAFDHARDGLRSSGRRLDELDSTLAEAFAVVSRLATLESADDWPEALTVQGTELTGSVDQAIQRALVQLEGARTDLQVQRSESGDIGKATALISTGLDEFEDRYAAVKELSGAHQAKLVELSELERRSSEAKSLHDEQKADRSRLGDPGELHRTHREQLIELMRERSAVVHTQCEKLGDLSEGLIKAELQRGVGLAPVKERFRSAITGSGVRSARVDGLFESLQDEDDSLAVWNQVLDEIEALITLDPDAPVKSSATPIMSRLGFPVADQDKARARITADSWLDLVLTPVHDHPSFRYEVKTAEYIDFEDASAGQQATALLRVLLAQPGVPLVIDQPEDDLDSQVVLDIVRRLWTAKAGRQLLFSSHNPNLVVNGDAELVIVCENRSAVDQSRGAISQLGAIDMDPIRDAITRIMEGGETAFKLRKEKYGF